MTGPGGAAGSHPLLAEVVREVAAGHVPPPVHLLCPLPRVGEVWRREHGLPRCAVRQVPVRDPHRVRGWDRLFVVEVAPLAGLGGAPSVYDVVRHLERLGRAVWCTEDQVAVLAWLWSVHEPGGGS